MTIKLYCPGCYTEIEIELESYEPFGEGLSVGCHNTEEHDTGEPLVMYEKEERSHEKDA